MQRDHIPDLHLQNKPKNASLQRYLHWGIFQHRILKDIPEYKTLEYQVNVLLSQWPCFSRAQLPYKFNEWCLISNLRRSPIML